MGTRGTRKLLNYNLGNVQWVAFFPVTMLTVNNFNHLFLSFLVCKMGISVSFPLKVGYKNQKRS